MYLKYNIYSVFQRLPMLAMELLHIAMNIEHPIFHTIYQEFNLARMLTEGQLQALGYNEHYSMKIYCQIPKGTHPFCKIDQPWDNCINRFGHFSHHPPRTKTSSQHLDRKLSFLPRGHCLPFLYPYENRHSISGIQFINTISQYMSDTIFHVPIFRQT